MKRIRIEIGDLTLTASLNDTRLADRIAEALPILAMGSYWGEEIYFSIPIHEPNETSQEEVEIGAVAYWPPGNALCIFYGRTPASTGSKPKAASDVTVIGQLDCVPDALHMQQSLDSIRVSEEAGRFT